MTEEGDVNYLDALARRCQAASDAYDDAWYNAMAHDDYRGLEAAGDALIAAKHMYVAARAKLEPEGGLSWRDRLISSGNKPKEGNGNE